MLDWNDLRYFLAVAREGSTLAAGQRLRVSQTTVARRIAALEEALGFPALREAPGGLRADAAGEELLERAEQVESRREWLCRSGRGPVARRQRHREDHHRGNLSRSPCSRRCFASCTNAIRRSCIDLDDSQDFRDLGAGEADISLRSANGDHWPRGSSDASSASTIGRSTAAAIMPRGTAFRGPVPS